MNTQPPITHTEQILNWIKTSAPDINLIPQRTLYERYRALFGAHNALSFSAFGRTLSKQNIGRTSMNIDGKIMKRYTTKLNPYLIYWPPAQQQPCTYCQGRGFITIAPPQSQPPSQNV